LTALFSFPILYPVCVNVFRTEPLCFGRGCVSQMRVLQPNLCFGLNPWPRNATAPAGPVRPARGACTQRQSRDGQVGAQRTSRQIVPLSSCRADDASNASRPAGRLLRAAYGTRPRARHGYRSGSRSTSPRASSRVHVVPDCRRLGARAVDEWARRFPS
jgi:hypothetical protein